MWLVCKVGKQTDTLSGWTGGQLCHEWLGEETGSWLGSPTSSQMKRAGRFSQQSLWNTSGELLTGHAMLKGMTWLHSPVPGSLVIWKSPPHIHQVYCGQESPWNDSCFPPVVAEGRMSEHR